jgi:hypothetical protein
MNLYFGFIQNCGIEVDVEVRGDPDGKPFFLLIECKDWRDPVGIEAIDALDSKRKDLQADRCMICSNSGFTKKALRKAERLGIQSVALLSAGNKAVRLEVSRELVVKALAVERWSIILFPIAESNFVFPDQWDGRELYYQTSPVLNWFADKSVDLLRQSDGASTVTMKFAFKNLTVFTLEEVTVTLLGIQLNLTCSKKWLSQTVKEDVSIGYYDYFKKRITVPPKQFFAIGPSDQEAWEEISEPPERKEPELEPGSFRLDLTTLFKPIVKREGVETPRIDDIISEKEISFD